MAVATVFPTELTQEVIDRLSAPVPAQEIKTKDQGGSSTRFTSDKFVMRRLNDVVGEMGWEDDYTITALDRPIAFHAGQKNESQIIGQIVCRLTVLGVTKSGAADLEITPKMYGTPTTNAQARAFKRAAMKHGVAAELWDKELASSENGDEDEDDRTAPRKPSYQSKSTNQSSQSPAKSGQNGSSGASPAQAKFLNDAFGVPGVVAAQLSGGRDGTASQLITLLKDYKSKNEDAYESDPTPFIQRALKKTAPNLVAVLDAAAGEDEDDIDED